MSKVQHRMEKLKMDVVSCEAVESQRRTLFKELFEMIDALQAQLSETEAELSDKKDAIGAVRNRESQAKLKVDQMLHERERHASALVLIDGDSMQFRDELVKQGSRGGAEAASLLKQAVTEELRRTLNPAAPNVSVVIYVYANMRGLAKTYKEMAMLPVSGCLDDFVRGFNMGDTLCHYLDAGDGKECSDEKVKAMFRHHLHDVHCRRIFFGGSTDNGYARMLKPHLLDEDICGRITLLRGPPFAQELADIQARVRVISADSVFRTEKLVVPKRRVSLYGNMTPPMTPSLNYATAARAPGGTAIAISTLQAKTADLRTIFRNEKNQRVDIPLSYSHQDFVELKARKLCNGYYILGRCAFDEGPRKCANGHEGPLSGKQLLALRAVARLAACQRGLNCISRDCYAGHRCTRDRCTLGNQCFFTREMHNVDTKITSYDCE